MTTTSTTPHRFYVTTSIPYVNGEPHLGHALELVQADVLARHRRLRGAQVRFLTGTDDNALKNVTAAREAGVDVREFVDANARRFAGLRDTLSLSTDDFIRTSADPRHAPGVERLWRQCAARGDFYRRRYEGLYCAGCEQFYTSDELVDGRCTEHGTTPELVAEENWFFRLSTYAGRLLRLIESSTVRIEPAPKRREVLAFIRAGLTDFSVSRPAARAGGWGIPVPDDPDQVVYVWWDALTNYVTALDYGTDGAAYRDWWKGSDARVHVIGKGIVRFHAVYWLALLLSAGQPLPTTIFVHDYLSAEGAKISKSAGTTVDPVQLAERHGTDALRWWFVREVPRVGDTDFTVERLVARHDGELANGLGNLVHRSLSLVHRYRDGRVPDGAGTTQGDATRALTGALTRALTGACEALPGRVDHALSTFDLRAATDAVWRVVDEANRLVETARPWELARREREDGASRSDLDQVLAVLVRACRLLASELAPFIPDGAARLAAQLGEGSRIEQPVPTFLRLDREPVRA